MSHTGLTPHLRVPWLVVGSTFMHLPSSFPFFPQLVPLAPAIIFPLSMPHPTRTSGISVGSIFGIYEPSEECRIEDMDDPEEMMQKCVAAWVISGWLLG